MDQPASGVCTASIHALWGTTGWGFNADRCWCGATGIPSNRPATFVFPPAGN